MVRARQPLAAPAAPAVSSQAASAANLDARFASAEAAIRQQAAAGQHKPTSFTVTDPEITARVNEAVSRGEVQVPVSDVRVNTAPGQVNISGQARASLIAV